MSSAGQVVGGAIGAFIGFSIAGPTGALYGAQLGMMGGGLIDPPKGPNLQGPRLSDLTVQTSTYGESIGRNYGTIAHTGNVFWLLNNALTESAATQSQGGKVGGGESSSTSYSYSATFAVGFAQCDAEPMLAVRRIWVGNKLIYNARATTLTGIIASNRALQNINIYYGSDTQEPDPLIQADMGVANTPAYRGLAYLVFDNYPLAEHGNSLMGAPVKVEWVGPLTLGATSLTAPTETEDWVTLAAPNVQTLPATGGGNGHNLLTWARLVNSSYEMCNLTLSTTELAMIVYAEAPGEGRGRQFGAGLEMPENWITGTGVAGAAAYNPCDSRATVFYRYNAATYLGMFYVDFSGTPLVNDVRRISNFVADETALICAKNDNHLYVKIAVGGSYSIYYADLDQSVPEGMITMTLLITSTLGEIITCDADGWYACKLGSTRIFPHGSGTASSTIAEGRNTATGLHRVAGGFYVEVRPSLYFISDAGTITTIGTVQAQYAGGYVYGGYCDGVWVSPVTDIYNEFKLDWYGITVADSTPPTLADIVEAECLKSALLEAADIDVTDLTDTVRGYRVSKVASIRAALEPLQAAWPFDVLQSGYGIRFVRRGGSSVATITSDELDARPGDNAPGTALTISREMDSQLPARLNVNYLDYTRVYDAGQQYAERLNTDAVAIENVELAIPMTANEATQTADVLLYQRWLDRYDVGPIKLPPTYLDLEPADVVTLTGDHGTYSLRLTQVTYNPDGSVVAQAKYNATATYTSPAEGDEGEATGPELDWKGETVFELLDLPTMIDSQDQPSFIVAISGTGTAWPGGTVYSSADNGANWNKLYSDIVGATMGYATDTLAAHNGAMVDRAGVLTVRLWHGELASIDRDAQNNGRNLMAYGADGRWELIAPATCVEQVDGSWQLSNCLRGRYGTEWASSLHESGDRIVLLDGIGQALIPVSLRQRGLRRRYRGVNFGASIDSGDTVNFKWEGMNYLPLAPVLINGNRDPSTLDWTLTWVRRTRIRGAWQLGLDQPVAEASESYEIDIFSSGTYTTLKRTLTASTPTVAYTSAQQVSDFGSNQTTLYLRIYQISATVGRGTVYETSITR